MIHIDLSTLLSTSWTKIKEEGETLPHDELLAHRTVQHGKYHTLLDSFVRRLFSRWANQETDVSNTNKKGPPLPK